MPGRGVLVTIDGPGGVGKSTTVKKTARHLKKAGARVFSTRQPTTSVLGQYIRATTETYRGMALALLVAADRMHQQDTEIEPHLDDGDVVLCDRYLPSSLVLQGIDGVPAETVWAMNAGIRVPDIAVFLRADPAMIDARMRARGGPHDRFETMPGYAVREQALFDIAAGDLTARGWPVHIIDCNELWPHETATVIADLIETTLSDTEPIATHRSPA